MEYLVIVQNVDGQIRKFKMEENNLKWQIIKKQLLQEEKTARKLVEVSTIRSGQVRPYADSIYEYMVTSDLDEDYVKLYCTTILHPSKNEGGGTWNGSCNFPHGLNSFYSFKKMEKTEKTFYNYKYMVCEPYTG